MDNFCENLKKLEKNQFLVYLGPKWFFRKIEFCENLPEIYHPIYRVFSGKFEYHEGSSRGNQMVYYCLCPPPSLHTCPPLWGGWVWRLGGGLCIKRGRGGFAYLI